MDVVPPVVARLLSRADGTLLACRRVDDRSAAGKWEFPSGEIGPNERTEAALAHELQEELGIDVVVRERIDRSVTLLGKATL